MTGASLWAPLMPLAGAGLGFGFPLLLTLLASVAAAPRAARRRVVSGGSVIIAAGSLVLALHLQASGSGLPTGVRSTFSGYAASGHTDVEERSAARQLRGALDPARRNYVAGWPGFAIALYGQLEDRLEVLPTAVPPPGNLQLAAGSVLVLQANGHDTRGAWQRRLPAYLALAPLWSAGKWTAYRVGVVPGGSRPAPAPRGPLAPSFAPSPAAARGGIISAEASHAHPRR